MSYTKPTTELDFDRLKTDIINFIKGNPTFTDYNFEGSALNTIIDVLAYNTHNNAYYANMLHGESFIDSAQKRNSVVSRAKEFGYIPRSVVGSTAYINLNVDMGADSSSIVLNRGTKFTSTNDNGSFTFNVVDNHISEYLDGSHKFNNLKIVCGTIVSNNFKVDSISNPKFLFTIPNKNVDVSTLKVYLRDSNTALSLTEYKLSENTYENKPTDLVYFIQETYDGFFQIYFGENVIGRQPINGNAIDISYVVANDFGAADLCRSFIFNGNILNSLGVNITTVQQSFGGSQKEKIESIKTNAIKSRSAKERAVTVGDYELALMEKFNFIKSVSVWGGEKNNPPVYGKVFVSIQPISGYVITDTVKRDVITPALRSISMLTVSPEYVDPSYINMDFITKIKFSPTKTISNRSLVEESIKRSIVDYIDSISKFNGDYLESYLMKTILDLDPGIISVDVDKKVGFKMEPATGLTYFYNKDIGNAIIGGTIESTKFIVFDSVPVSAWIKEIPNSSYTVQNSSGLVETITKLGLYSVDTGIFIKDIGTVNLSIGQFKLSLNVYSYITDTRLVSIKFEIKEDDFIVKNNYVLYLDTAKVDTKINLLENNRILTEIYDK